MVFFVQNQPPHQIFKGREVAWTLKNELRKQQSDFLIFRALEINTVSKYESLWHGLCRDCPYWAIPSHFCLTREPFGWPCWFWSLACQLNCSEHGRCDSFTKRCVCDPFWMENFIRAQMGDGESNCGTCGLLGLFIFGKQTVFENWGAE